MQVVCKLFLGDMVEEARRVQREHIDAGEKQTDLPDQEENKDGLSDKSKHRRQAPLRPEHLAEAYRRWQRSGQTGGSGGSMMAWNQQTRNGKERFAPRAGGKRLFR
jgi:transcription initiation factor TFIID subunit 11